MLSRIKLCRILVVLLCGFSPNQTWSQETTNAIPESGDGTFAKPATETAGRSQEEIPFSVMQQIVSGMQFNGAIKTDLSKDQIEAMKKIQSAHYQRNNYFQQLTSLVNNSPQKNRRFSQAIETLKEENEAELQKEWLALITPEQQASIRRRNRTVILQASLNRSRPAQSLLNNDTSVDALMTNNDLMSVIERPAIQDVLELTDDQFDKVEQLQLAAEGDAVNTLREAMKWIAKREVANPNAPVQSPALEKLQTETMKLLTEDQVAEYKKLKANSSKMHELIGPDAVKNPKAVMSLMMPHGFPIRHFTNVVDGNAIVDAEFNNAFAAPVLVKALKITEEQQAKIADLLKNSHDAQLAEMASRSEAYGKQRSERTDEFSKLLTAHNEKFHSQVTSLMTETQIQKLEKERLKGLSLWALRKPEVRSALEMTEDQTKSVEEILARRPKLLTMVSPALGGDFQKESEAFHKRARENSELLQKHTEQQNQDLQKLLTEPQQVKFSEMTGYRFTTGRSI